MRVWCGAVKQHPPGAGSCGPPKRKRAGDADVDVDLRVLVTRTRRPSKANMEFSARFRTVRPVDRGCSPAAHFPGQPGPYPETRSAGGPGPV